MAFLPTDPNQQTQPGQQQNQIPTVPQIPTLQGSGGPSAGAGSGTGATNTASPAAAPSTPWQNITTYLQANAGQAGTLGNAIAGNLQTQYNNANQAIGQTQQNFGQQIESARNPLDQGMASRAAANPSQFVQNPSDVGSFQKMLSGAYSGPQNFSGSPDYSKLQSQTQAAQQHAGLVNQGTPGLMTLLQETESQGGKNPTQGITALDSLLLQESPENFSQIAAAAAPYAGLTDYLNSTQQGLDLSAQNAAKEAAATGSQIQGQFMGPGGVVPALQGKLNQGLQTSAGQARDYNAGVADIIGRLNSGQALSPDQANLIDPSGVLNAVNPASSSSVFQNALQFSGMSPGMLAQFYKQPDLLAAPTLANTVTPQEYADSQALNQLLGQDLGIAPAPGTPFSVPQTSGTFDDKAALQALYDTLQGDSGILAPPSSLGSLGKGLLQPTDQQSQYANDFNYIASLLGQPQVNYTNGPGPSYPTGTLPALTGALQSGPTYRGI